MTHKTFKEILMFYENYLFDKNCLSRCLISIGKRFMPLRTVSFETSVAHIETKRDTAVHHVTNIFCLSTFLYSIHHKYHIKARYEIKQAGVRGLYCSNAHTITDYGLELDAMVATIDQLHLRRCCSPVVLSPALEFNQLYKIVQEIYTYRIRIVKLYC